MVNVKAVIWRPVPVEKIRIWPLPVPVPLDGLPETGDGVAYLAFRGVVAFEVLPRRQQSLHQESSLHQIPSVVIRTEVGNHLAGSSIKKVRPHAMKTIGLCEEAHNLQEPIGAL